MIYINRKYQSDLYEDEECIYFRLKALLPYSGVHFSSNNLALDDVHYELLFRDMKASGYITDYGVARLKNSVTVLTNNTDVTPKGEDYIRDVADEYEDAYQAFVKRLRENRA